MGLSVVEAGSGSGLILLSEVKRLLSITDSSQDVTLQSLIQATSVVVEEHCDRVFGAQRYMETLAGDGSCELSLSRWPIIGAPTVTVEGEIVTDYTVDRRDIGILFREIGWAWSAQFGGRLETRRIAGSERREIEVTYSAGYVLPGDPPIDGAPPLPSSVTRATWLVIQDALSTDVRDPNIRSRTQAVTPDGSITLQYAPPSAAALPANAIDLLKGFRQ